MLPTSILSPEPSLTNNKSSQLTSYPYNVETFKKLPRDQQEIYLQQFIKPPQRELTAFIFLPNFALVVRYKPKYEAVYAPAEIQPMLFHSAMDKAVAVRGPKLFWSYLTDRKIKNL